jgi:hypothetical protein
VGQKSRYLGFTITNDTIKSYQADTLIVEISGETDSGFVFLEYYSNGSASKATDDTTYTYLLHVSSDTITFRVFNYLDMGSRLLRKSGLYKIPTSFTSEGSFDIDTLRPSYYIAHPFKGTVERIDLLNCSFNNMYIINDNSLCSIDGAGYVFVFNKPEGFVYLLTYSSGFVALPKRRSGRGWEFMPF